MSANNNIQDILISQIKKYFMSDDKINDFRHIDKDKEFNLHCGGREDVDVRMIGRPGRPFQVKVTNMDLLPKIEDLNQLFEKFNKDGEQEVKFFNFRQADKTISEYMHKCQEKKFKIYNCLIKINEMDKMNIENKLEYINKIENLKV